MLRKISVVYLCTASTFGVVWLGEVTEVGLLGMGGAGPDDSHLLGTAGGIDFLGGIAGGNIKLSRAPGGREGAGQFGSLCL